MCLALDTWFDRVYYPGHMPNRNHTSTFAAQLHRQLADRGWGVRTLARHMVDPSVEGWDRHVRVEAARRKLNNYLLGGTQPTRESVQQIEQALGMEPGVMSAMEDDSRDLEMVAVLLDQLAAIQERRASRAKVPA